MSRVHIVGAGVSGLAAAVRLADAGRRVVIHESSGHAGGRCRSFHDSTLDCAIDNGNHLLLTGNRSAHAYLEEIGAAGSLIGPDEAAYPFVDLGSGARWTVRLNRGPVPWWILCPGRRPPGTRAADFLSALRLLFAGPDATVSGLFGRAGAVYARFLAPLAIAVLNTPLDKAAAAPLRTVLRETFARGGDACLPRIARSGLSESFITPAIAHLRARGAEIHFNSRLRTVEAADGRVSRLSFGDETVEIDPDDRIVLAVPPASLHAVLPEIPVPSGSHAIVNAHFRLDAPPVAQCGPILGLLGGTAEWLFVRGCVVSATVSAADRLADAPAGEIAERIWRDIATALGLTSARPRCRIVKERRATFAQTPAALRDRPGTETAFSNLVLAGDWTDTGLPATIEGAIRSGHRAAATLLTHSARNFAPASVC